MFQRNDKRKTAKSIHALQLAVLSDIQLQTRFTKYGTSNANVLSILMISFLKNHAFHDHQTSMNHLLIPMLTPIILQRQLHHRLSPHPNQTIELLKYTIKSSFNNRLRYKSLRPIETFSLIMTPLHLLTLCEDRMPNYGGKHSVMKSGQSSHGKHGHSYRYRLTNELYL